MLDQTFVLYDHLIDKKIKDLESKMPQTSASLDFERAANEDNPAALVLTLMAAVEAYERNPTRSEYTKLKTLFHRIHETVK